LPVRMIATRARPPPGPRDDTADTSHSPARCRRFFGAPPPLNPINAKRSLLDKRKPPELVAPRVFYSLPASNSHTRRRADVCTAQFSRSPTAGAMHDAPRAAHLTILPPGTAPGTAPVR